MFQVNDTVMYGNSGVCRITDIRPEKFGKEKVMYYVLKPLDGQNATIYCPVNTGKDKIRKLLSREEILNLIHTASGTKTEWIVNEQIRKEKFHEILRRGEHRELIQLLKTLYTVRKEKIAAGRKLHVADEKMMKEAESILYGEFAHVLNISREEVLPFILGEIHNTEADRLDG